MPPSLLFRRDDHDEDDYYRCYDNGIYVRCYSAWNEWVRWVVLAVILIGFFVLFFLCSCITARRRRRAGLRPFYGTGWLAAHPGQPSNVQPYYTNAGIPQQPAPPYSPPQNTPAYGTYFGQQNSGIEMHNHQPAPPPAAYAAPQGGQTVYPPPSGSPPNKT